MKKKARKNKYISMTITIHPNDKKRIGNIAKMTNKTEAEVVRQFIKSAFDAVDIIDEQSLKDVGGSYAGIERPGKVEEHFEDRPMCKAKKIGFGN